MPFQTDPALPTIGLGCVTFGREIDEAASHALLDHAWARGVRHFDTASGYAQGASEEILGSWLNTRRPEASSICIATKILPPKEPGQVAADLERSLQRLGVSALDLLYLHRWEAAAESPAVLAALHELVRGGRVRALGACNCSLAQLRTALALQQRHGLSLLRFVQNNHNLAVSLVSPELRAFCAAEQIAIVTYSPLGAGFLTGKHRHGVQAGSRFDLVPGHQEVYFHEAAHRRLARLEAVAARTGHSPAHLALAWALHQPGVATVLVGGRTAAHLDQAFAASSFEAAELFAELTADPD